MALHTKRMKLKNYLISCFKFRFFAFYLIISIFKDMHILLINEKKAPENYPEELPGKSIQI